MNKIDSRNEKRMFSMFVWAKEEKERVCDENFTVDYSFTYDEKEHTQKKNAKLKSLLK